MVFCVLLRKYQSVENSPGVGLEEGSNNVATYRESLELFFWGCVKNIVYQSSLRVTDEPKSRIIVAIHIVDSPMLYRM